jgi:hypothetical protein
MQTGEGLPLLRRTTGYVKATLETIGTNGGGLPLDGCGLTSHIRYISRDGLRGKSDECAKTIEMLDAATHRCRDGNLDAAEAAVYISHLTQHYEALARCAAEGRLLLRDAENTIRSIWSSNVDGHFQCDNNFIVKGKEKEKEKPYVLLKRSIRRKPLAEISLESLVYIKENHHDVFAGFHPIREMVMSDAIKERYNLQGGRREQVVRREPLAAIPVPVREG